MHCSVLQMTCARATVQRRYPEIGSHLLGGSGTFIHYQVSTSAENFGCLQYARILHFNLTGKTKKSNPKAHQETQFRLHLTLFRVYGPTLIHIAKFPSQLYPLNNSKSTHKCTRSIRIHAMPSKG